MLWHHCGTCSSSRMHPCSQWNVWWNSTSDLFSLNRCYKGIQKKIGCLVSKSDLKKDSSEKKPVERKSLVSWRSWSPRHREWQRSVDELLNQLDAEGRNLRPQRPSWSLKSPQATPQVSPQASPRVSPQASPRVSPQASPMEEGSWYIAYTCLYVYLYIYIIYYICIDMF